MGGEEKSLVNCGGSRNTDVSRCYTLARWCRLTWPRRKGQQSHRIDGRKRNTLAEGVMGKLGPAGLGRGSWEQHPREREQHVQRPQGRNEIGGSLATEVRP